MATSLQTCGQNRIRSFGRALCGLGTSKRRWPWLGMVGHLGIFWFLRSVLVHSCKIPRWAALCGLVLRSRSSSWKPWSRWTAPLCSGWNAVRRKCFWPLMDSGHSPPVTCPVFPFLRSRILRFCHYHFPAKVNMKHITLRIVPSLVMIIWR